MNNSAALLRTLIIYAVCVPLAIVVGYMAVSLGNSPSYSNFTMFGVLALVLIAPILLRWHHPLLVLSWNLPLTIFFLPGNPPAYLPMLVLSLGISVLQRAMNRNMRFIPAPQITLPLLCLTLVALVTAKLTGRHRFARAGGTGHGRQKIRLAAGGNFGFFCAHRAADSAPSGPDFTWPCSFWGDASMSLGDLISFIPRSFYFIFLFFPADSYTYTGSKARSSMRFAGVGVGPRRFFHTCWRGMASVEFSWRANRGGWRPLLLFSALSLFGGIPFDAVELRAAFYDSIFSGRHAPHQTAADLLPSSRCWARLIVHSHGEPAAAHLSARPVLPAGEH